MKDKLVKSYVLFGNLPIYKQEKEKNPGRLLPEGCEFVINFRLKYELGLLQMQFAAQNQSHLYNVENAKFNSEIELDVANISRLITLLEIEEIITYNDNDYIHISSTRNAKLLQYQKAGFVRIKDNILSFIIDDKKQEHFKIVGQFQIQCFLNLLKQSLNSLSSSYIQYDIYKQHVENKEASYIPIVKNAPDIPAPLIAPISVTKEVIPQAPQFN